MTPTDRISIPALLEANLGGPAIALNLGFNCSTINRELNCRKAKSTASASDYRAGLAKVRSQQRRRDAAGWVRTRSRRCGTRLSMAFTAVGSPQQIAGKLAEMNKSASFAAQACWQRH